MLHAKIHWPIAITTNLWPYALRNTVDSKNATCRIGKTLSPIEVFTSSRVRPQLDHLHYICSPCYVLQNELQVGKKIGIWLLRARLGIYLGMSPRHAQTVALILNPRTGLTSPQFHVKFDELFEIVKGPSVPEHGQWLTKCTFKIAPKANQHASHTRLVGMTPHLLYLLKTRELSIQTTLDSIWSSRHLLCCLKHPREKYRILMVRLL
jgi:hypothetical protein